MSIKINDDEIKFDFSFFESEDSLLNMSMAKVKKESRKRSKEKSKVLIIFLVIIFILALYFGKSTKKFSLFLFANNDYKRCTLLNKLDIYQYNIRYLFLFVMYSYLNIYATFCYLVLDIIINIFNDLLRLFFFESRPFWEQNNVFPCVCDFTPSQPSHTSNNSILFMSLVYFLKKLEKPKFKHSKSQQKKTIFKIYTENEDENSEQKEDSSQNMNSSSQNDKISSICLTILEIFIVLLIIFVDSIPLLQNIEYLHQTLFGFFFGFAIYYWTFHIVRINHLNRKHFMKIVGQPWIVMTFSTILFIIILLIQNKVNTTITTTEIMQIKKFCEMPKDLNINKEIVKNSYELFEILGAYFGLLLEYKLVFKSNDEKFCLFNIKSKNSEGYFQQSGMIKLLRFVLLFTIEIVFFRTIIEFWIKHNLKGWLEYLSLSIVVFLKGLFFFYYMKIIMRKLGLINNKIFEENMIDEDEDL